MATSNSFLRDYSQLNTIPALSGVAFALASAVQFLGGTFALTTPTYTFDPGHAMIVSLMALVIAFASSDTKDWRYYETWEQGIVAVAVFLMVGMEYLTQVQNLVTSNDPVGPLIAFGLAMAAWGVLAR